MSLDPNANKTEEIDKKLTTDYLIKCAKVNVARKIAAGKVGLLPEFEALKRLEQEQTPIDNPGPAEEQIGIEDRYRPKRKYTVTDAVRERNSKAGKISAEKHPAKNWRTGKHARSAITSLRPCKASCLKYPCNLIEIDKVHPGEACLDAAELVDTFETFLKAVKENKFDDYKEMVALDLAQMRNVLNMCLQAVQIDTPRLYEEKYGANGQVIGRSLKSHPLLPEITKMAEKLGVTAEQSMITEQAIAKHGEIEDATQGFVKMMAAAGGQMKKAQEIREAQLREKEEEGDNE